MAAAIIKRLRKVVTGSGFKHWNRYRLAIDAATEAELVAYIRERGAIYEDLLNLRNMDSKTDAEIGQMLREGPLLFNRLTVVFDAPRTEIVRYTAPRCKECGHKLKD